jgi:hypothetical protein
MPGECPERCEQGNPDQRLADGRSTCQEALEGGEEA